MKMSLAIVAAMFLIGSFAGVAYADGRDALPPYGGREIAPPPFPPHERGLMPRGEGIPYGDNCPLCSPYGACKEELKPKEAIRAIKAYFGDKGLAVKNIEAKGRFIKADVFRGPALVDRIIFDKKTGRIRSIY